jgi:hypothetical protein
MDLWTLINTIFKYFINIPNDIIQFIFYIDLSLLHFLNNFISRHYFIIGFSNIPNHI